MVNAKARDKMEILVEKFNEWADERIVDYAFAACDLAFVGTAVRARINMLEWAKINIKRLAEEIAND